MKKITTLFRKIYSTAGIFLVFILCNMQLGIAQEMTDTSVRADTISPQLVQVTRQGGKLTALIYLKNGQIVELNDSLSRSFISQSYEGDQQAKAYTFVEQMPEFPGGEDAMVQYLSSHARYPQRARANNIQGTVIVQFVVCEDGKLRDIKTLGKNIGWDLENEAVRVVREMPDWIPGRYNGQPVNVQYSIPIRFALSGKAHFKLLGN